MTPEDLERLRAARIYDAEADDAADQLALLERLETRGLGPDALTAMPLLPLVLTSQTVLAPLGARRLPLSPGCASGC